MVERLPRARGPEFESQRPAKSYTALQTVAVLPWRNDAEMGTANSLHASV